LTQEAFVKFHDKYYHPSNSHILLYGNGDLLKEMSFIDKEYLSKYSRQSTPDIFPLQKPFTEMKKLVLPYPVSEGTETANQTYLSFSAVVGQNQDRALVMALNTICDVLINQEAGPIRIALQKAGIGKDVSAYVDEKRQNVFNIQVQNANTGDMENFFKIITEGLKDAAEKGLDKKAVEGSISRTEFALREGNSAQKGLNFAFQIIPGWFFAGDPFLTLEYEKHLAKLKWGLKKSYLEEIIKKQILGNPHSVLSALEPMPGLDKQLTARSEQKLKSYAESLSQEEKETLLNDTKELIAYQKREDTPEALATIPMLERKDINPEANYYEVKEKKVKDVPVLDYEEFANNVVYLRLYFDLRTLPQELLQYAPLLAEVLGNQNTENHSFGELENLLNINTGGFSAFTNAFSENRDDNKLLPKFVVSSKSMNTKTADMLSLLSEILNKTRYSDTGRLKDIITRYQARLDASIKSNGLVFTQIRAMSYFSNAGMFNETTGGIDFYKFITYLSKNFEAKSEEIKANLAKAAGLLFSSRNLVVSVTGSGADCNAFEKPLADFIETLPSNTTGLNAWNFNPVKKNEGFQTASKVQYVIEGYNYKKLGYSWDGKMKVLNQILSRDWLQNRIRVIGGAYGGFFSIDELGNALFMSYRDPNLKETIDNYNATADYLDKLEISEKDMTRYIIGTIAGMDLPLTVLQKGSSAVTNYFNKISREDVQKTREAVLNTKPDDIKAFREMIKKITAQNVICVYGNEQKISSQKEMFDNVEKLF
ncbi:MAG: insulinase family protein, partial [Syntrophothermus sp.]